MNDVRHRIIQRMASDDYTAWLTAEAMEAVGFEVFSMILEQCSPCPPRWYVFGRTRSYCGQAEWDRMTTELGVVYDRLARAGIETPP